MSRRGILAALLTSAAVVAAAPKLDALLVGDSLAYQLGPRLGPAMAKLDPRRRLALDGRGGTSAREWLRKGWFRRALDTHPTGLVLVSLGVNCVRQERPKLARDVEDLAELAGSRRVLWLLPSSAGYLFPLDYAHEAVRAAGVELCIFPVLPLESDRVHLTDTSNKKLAGLLVERLWPKGGA